jgi:hypothetical protein
MREGEGEANGTPSIAILPWMNIYEPVSIRGIEILPRQLAIEEARSIDGADLSRHVEIATSYFCSGSRVFRVDQPDPIEVEPQFVEPAVVFLNDRVTVRHLDDALALLNFACMARNNVRSSYTNSTVFQRYLQGLKGDPGRILIPLSRRMFPTKWIATQAINLIEAKQYWSGEFQTPDPAHKEAMEALPLGDERADRILSALVTLMGATQEAETMSGELERSLYAVLLEQLLHPTDAEEAVIVAEINTERSAKAWKPLDAENISSFEYNLHLAKNLLRPLLHHEATGDRFGYHILRGWFAIREQRNAYFHPESRKSDLFEFEEQEKVRGSLIRFRVMQALVVASMVDAGFVPEDSRLALVVPAIESWLASIRKDDPREPEVASGTYNWWGHLWIAQRSFDLRRRDDPAHTLDWRTWLTNQVEIVSAQAGRREGPGGTESTRT